MSHDKGLCIQIGMSISKAKSPELFDYFKGFEKDKSTEAKRILDGVIKGKDVAAEKVDGGEKFAAFAESLVNTLMDVTSEEGKDDTEKINAMLDVIIERMDVLKTMKEAAA